MYAYGLPRALRRQGHFVYVPRPEEGLGELRQVLDVVGPDLVLTMGWTQRQGPESLRSIQDHCAARRSLHVYWSTEDPLHTDVWTLPLLAVARPDAVATISPTSVALLREFGYPTELLPFACDPGQYRPQPAHPYYAVDVALVATLYPTGPEFRRQSLEWMLRPLVGSGVTVGIWGTGWEYADAHLGFEVPRAWLLGPAGVGAARDDHDPAAVVLLAPA